VVAAKLLERGKQVRAVARDPKKLEALRAKGAEVFAGDVTDDKAVTAALQGAEGAYMLFPPDNSSTDLIGRNRAIAERYAAGLAAAKVPHAVMLSSVGAQVPSGTGPIVTTHHAEAILPKSGAKLTFLRAAYFMENALANAWPMKNDGVLPVFGGGEKYPFPQVATKDIGTTAADALLSPKTQVIELAGPKEFSFEDVAAEASRILGKPVKCVVMPIDQLVPTYMKFGISKHVAELYREMTEAFGAGKVGFEHPERLVRGTTALADALRPGLR
jgi:uncharacterized protein YbjT (DUF2867 family)